MTNWYLATHVWDTSWNRRRVSENVTALVLRIQKDSNDIHAQELLFRKMHSSYSFEAFRAVIGAGQIGDAAETFILELAALMKSPDPFIRREAALALSRLGPRSRLVVDLLAAKVEKEPSDETSWFAAEALGNSGRSSARFLPLLGSRLGTGAPQFDDCLRRAIERIEIDMQRSSDDK